MAKTRNSYTFYDKESEAVKRLSEKHSKSEAEVVRVAVRLLDEQDRAGFGIPQLKKKK
ncbi:hypothetical protein [Enterococcus sp. AZ196]|uniref:hypothetical protein n=1 Tax=Enterococcus sp. AZ196 TaxID=2774659 RepID=UPI003D2C28BF